MSCVGRVWLLLQYCYRRNIAYGQLTILIDIADAYWGEREYWEVFVERRESIGILRLYVGLHEAVGIHFQVRAAVGDEK